jgi:hypothetical protein
VYVARLQPDQHEAGFRYDRLPVCRTVICPGLSESDHSAHGVHHHRPAVKSFITASTNEPTLIPSPLMRKYMAPTPLRRTWSDKWENCTPRRSLGSGRDELACQTILRTVTLAEPPSEKHCGPDTRHPCTKMESAAPSLLHCVVLA